MGSIASWFSLGGRFPALAVFGLPALTVALALVVLWGLRPWEDNSGAPPEVPLGIEMAVGGGQALPEASEARVAAGVAVPGGPRVQTAQRVSSDAGPVAAPAPVGVAPGRAIAVVETPSSPAAPAPESGAGEEVPSVGTTAGEVPPEGTSSPVATPPSSSGGSAGGPVTAGGNPPVLESCEGDEYVITITFLDEETAVEEAPVEIVLERLNEDGTIDELELEGDLGDARSLASTLESEGNCVRVEIAQPEDEESAEEVPGTGEEVTAPAESLEPDMPRAAVPTS